VKGWVIPPSANGQFVADMEKVLDVYKRPYNESNPVVCMDESPKQMIREVRPGLTMNKGRDARVDYEYERCGVCNIFMANEPLAEKREVKVTGQKTKGDWAEFIRYLADEIYPDKKRITLVMDNYNTHKAGSFYERFAPEEAKRLSEKFEFVYTPVHGSWLNMAEIELNVLMGQCLNRYLDNIDIIKSEVDAWQNARNNKNSKIDWQFTTQDARIKLKRLYPSYHV